MQHKCAASPFHPAGRFPSAGDGWFRIVNCKSYLINNPLWVFLIIVMSQICDRRTNVLTMVKLIYPFNFSTRFVFLTFDQTF